MCFLRAPGYMSVVMTERILTAAALALALAACSGAPAIADGAASTRNILLGGAAAAAGTLLIINHNKQVHQHYADDARRQAESQAQANNAQAAYAAERRAYDNEVSVNAQYKHEVTVQHSLIATLRKQVAQEKARADRFAQTREEQQPSVPAAVHAVAAGAPQAGVEQRPLRVAGASWGWGQL
jgi:hypothetical protein